MDYPVDYSTDEFMVIEGYTSKKLSTNANEQQLVKNLVKENRVVIFSKSTCVYCERSKTLLNDMGVTYMAIELDHMQEGHKLQSVLGYMTGVRTVPRIFIDGKCIGGSYDLKALKKSGALKELLNDPLVI